MTFKRAFVAISGITRLGKTLESLVLGVPVGTDLRYQWYRDGVAISGADSKFYTVTSVDRNARLDVKVTISKQGFESLLLESKSKLIG